MHDLKQIARPGIQTFLTSYLLLLTTLLTIYNLKFSVARNVVPSWLKCDPSYVTILYRPLKVMALIFFFTAAASLNMASPALFSDFSFHSGVILNILFTAIDAFTRLLNWYPIFISVSTLVLNSSFRFLSSPSLRKVVGPNRVLFKLKFHLLKTRSPPSTALYFGRLVNSSASWM